ncbi:nicotinamide-nucleotide adenylyltransferase [Candidatus Woesearchaeota archaeon]|nr:nicotinamide-nucleotide adenylyltransferase [Candidatus Woesearchaeota archaeon]
MILILGRFQPLHNGHMKVIREAFDKDEEIVIAIGSAGRVDEKENPFSGEERAEMIRKVLDLNGIPARIVLVPNTPTDKGYVQHVEKHIGAKPDKVMTENPWTIDLFSKAGYDVVVTDRHFQISSTKIRKLIASGERWEHFVPSPVPEFIRSIGGIERIKKTEDL